MSRSAVFALHSVKATKVLQVGDLTSLDVEFEEVEHHISAAKSENTAILRKAVLVAIALDSLLA